MYGSWGFTCDFGLSLKVFGENVDDLAFLIDFFTVLILNCLGCKVFSIYSCSMESERPISPPSIESVNGSGINDFDEDTFI